MTDMDTLLAFSEVAAALAGFAAIVLVLGRGSLREWTEAERFRLVSLVSTSMGALLFALLPMGLLYLQLPERLAIRGASGAFALWFAYRFVRVVLDIRRMHPLSRATISPSYAGVYLAIVLAGFLSLLSGMLGFGFRPGSFNAYGVGLTASLALAAVQFLRILQVGVEGVTARRPGPGGQLD